MNEPWSYFEISSLLIGGIVLFLIVHHSPAILKWLGDVAALIRGFFRDWRRGDEE